jgi:hypothetical protein
MSLWDSFDRRERPAVDESTRQEIDTLVERTLREAGLTTPPVHVEELLEFLELHRDFYDLEDPNLLQRLRHKVKVGGQRLIKVVRKVRLVALWLPDQERIMVDSSLPPPRWNGRLFTMPYIEFCLGTDRTSLVTRQGLLTPTSRRCLRVKPITAPPQRCSGGAFSQERRWIRHPAGRVLSL